MLKKRDAVTNTTALNSMLTNMQIPLDGDVLLRSDEYDFPIVVCILQNGGDDTQFLPLIGGDAHPKFILAHYLEIERTICLPQYIGRC
jgi:hypothetical protein